MTLGSLSRERWNLLEPLLDAALEVEPARRSVFLDEACGSDAALRDEVAALVAACELGDTILSDPAAITYAPLLAQTTIEPPSLIGGRYHVVREIGRGGMGTVYLADDPKHGRQVAVKTLHAEVARLIGRQPAMEVAARAIAGKQESSDILIGRTVSHYRIVEKLGAGGSGWEMNGDTTPGQTGSVSCPHCGGAVFFPFSGGPHQVPCPSCRKTVYLEVVHDGTKWRSKIIKSPRP